MPAAVMPFQFVIGKTGGFAPSRMLMSSTSVHRFVLAFPFEKVVEALLLPLTTIARRPRRWPHCVPHAATPVEDHQVEGRKSMGTNCATDKGLIRKHGLIRVM